MRFQHHNFATDIRAVATTLDANAKTVMLDFVEPFWPSRDALDMR
jgi:hypothetical protein